MKEEFLKIALGEVGYTEGKNNDNKYGIWFGKNNCAWCAIFVDWVANQVGALNTLIPKYSGCGNFYNWYKDKNLITKNPKAGDIGFIKPTKTGATCSHVFIVYEVNGNTITSIDGNYPDGVKKVTRKLTDSNILGFGSVQWPEESSTASEETKDNQENASSDEKSTSLGENISYKVVKGDNLTKICKKYYGKYTKELGTKIVNANKAKYKKITLNYIQAGWTLVIPK